MSAIENATLRAGDLLIVKPGDKECPDPEALARDGQRCQFVRHIEGPALDYVVVRFSTKGRNVYMRLRDLEKVDS